MTIDIKDYFLQTFMQDVEYMRIHSKYFLKDIKKNMTLITKLPLNGPIRVECKTLRRVVTSAAEAETAELFYNSQLTMPICHMSNICGRIQPATPIKKDNSIAASFVNYMLKQKRSK